MCPSIRVAIADDHPALLIGIAHELGSLSSVEIAGTARCSGELIRLLDAQACTTLVTDYTMPGGAHGDGAALLAFLRRRYPAVTIIVLTMMDHPGVIQAILRQGITCIVSKADPTIHIAHAVHAARSGKPYYSPTIAEIVSGLDRDAPRAGILTRREAEVMRLYLSGMTINEIAARLNRTKQTASAQKKAAMKKLGLERESDLFKYALESGNFP